MMDAKDLEIHMAHCCGTEFYYKTVWGFAYTDGVREFAKNAEAYWFIDEVGVFLAKNAFLRDEFLSISLEVKGNKADIIYKEDSDAVIQKKHIPFTDCPEGVWNFYFDDGVLLWNSEY